MALAAIRWIRTQEDLATLPARDDAASSSSSDSEDSPSSAASSVGDVPLLERWRAQAEAAGVGATAAGAAAVGVAPGSSKGGGEEDASAARRAWQTASMSSDSTREENICGGQFPSQGQLTDSSLSEKRGSADEDLDGLVRRSWVSVDQPRPFCLTPRSSSKASAQAGREAPQPGAAAKGDAFQSAAAARSAARPRTLRQIRRQSSFEELSDAQERPAGGYLSEGFKRTAMRGTKLDAACDLLAAKMDAQEPLSAVSFSIAPEDTRRGQQALEWALQANYGFAPSGEESPVTRIRGVDPPSRSSSRSGSRLNSATSRPGSRPISSTSRPEGKPDEDLDYRSSFGDNSSQVRQAQAVAPQGPCPVARRRPVRRKTADQVDLVSLQMQKERALQGEDPEQPAEQQFNKFNGIDESSNHELKRVTFADTEMMRVTFADNHRRKGSSSNDGGEYRPRIKFLNVLSSVDTTVAQYIEAVSQEVCRVLLASICLMLFGDDIREEIWCFGPADKASCMRRDTAIIGTTVRDGTQGTFKQTPGEPSLKDPALENAAGGPIRSLLCLPIRHMLDQGRTIGAIAVINKTGAQGAVFSDADVKVLQDIARLASDSFYRQRWKALQTIFSSGDKEARALISMTKERKSDTSRPSASSEGGANMDVLSQKMTWIEIPLERRTAKVNKVQTLGFDALEYLPDELTGLVDVVMHHTGCVERCAIPADRLKNWAFAAKRTYRDNPFHNWFHGFSVFQMVYYQLLVSPIAEVFSSLDVFGLLIAALCHDLDHPGFTNNFMVDSQSELALRHNDMSVLENHHASLACELLRREDTAIGGSLDDAAQKSLRRVIIKCILDTDMTHHSEMCQKLLAKGGTEDRQLMLGMCIHASDLSAQVLPWKTASRWEERISLEFAHQASEERAAGRTPAPFMSFQVEDVKLRGKLQRDFCDFVLLPLWDPYTQQLSALRPCYRNLVKNRSFYEHRWNTGEDPDPKWCK